MENVQVTTTAGTERSIRAGDSVIGIALDDHELVQLQKPNLVAYDIYGKSMRL